MEALDVHVKTKLTREERMEKDREKFFFSKKINRGENTIVPYFFHHNDQVKCKGFVVTYQKPL